MELPARSARGARRALIGARKPRRKDEDSKTPNSGTAGAARGGGPGVGSPAGADHVRMFSAANLAATLPRFHVEKRIAGDTLIVTPHGELDAAAVPLIENDLLEAVGTTRAILLDLGSLTFIDSCGLWLITLTLSTCRREGVEFALTRGPQSIRSIFEVTGLSDVLPFLDDQE